MTRNNRFRYLPFAVAGIVLVIFWLLAAAAWQFAAAIEPVIFFGYLGITTGIGAGIYVGLPKHRRPLGRRLLIFSVGTGLLAAAFMRAYSQQMLIQIEGLFFEVLSGVFQAALLHYLLAKIIGPFLFGRMYCGWACWTAMILDCLPFKHSDGRLPSGWGVIRYVHLGLSLGLVALLWYGFAYSPGPGTALVWFLVGNALYYLVGIGLAVVLKDNRAFCKYVCPAGAMAKLPARYAVLKVKGNPEVCNGRHECVAVCPMDINITDYIKRGERVLSTECILCQQCINICPEGALSLSLGFDQSGVELLRTRETTA